MSSRLGFIDRKIDCVIFYCVHNAPQPQQASSCYFAFWLMSDRALALNMACAWAIERLYDKACVRVHVIRFVSVFMCEYLRAHRIVYKHSGRRIRYALYWRHLNVVYVRLVLWVRPFFLLSQWDERNNMQRFIIIDSRCWLSVRERQPQRQIVARWARCCWLVLRSLDEVT